MDKEKIGKFLTELRKSKNMTQSDVSKLLYTSRENISKWERGINMPTPDTLLELSKIYDVSVNEILIGERKSDVNQEQIDNFSAVILKETNVKIKKIKKCLIVVLSILIFIIVLFLFYYFLNTYNSIHVFLVSGVNENVSTVDGIAIFSKGKSYIKLGKVKLNNDKTIDNIDFFYYDKLGNKYTIVSSNEADYTLISINSYNQYFSYKEMNFIKENSYLKIIHEGTEEIIKLDFREDMSNNHFFYNENSNSINLNKDVLRQSGDIDILNIENYFKDNFQYDRKNRQYHKQIRTKEKSIDIYYSIDTYNITIFEKYNNKDIQISYNLTTGIIEYDENFSLKTITKKFIYDTKNNKCIFDVCDENIVEKILNNYLNNFIDYGKKK